jgi:5'(3')-deoxyribonucleotidase
MLIACDVDGVVCDTMQGFVDLTNHLYDGHRKTSQITNRDLGISLGLTDEQVRTVFRRLDWWGLYPVPLAVEMINELRCFHEVVFVTARHQEIPTAGWLSKFLATPVVHNVPASEKAEFCLNIGALVLVEDRPSEIEACDAVGFPTILLDQPWNREVDHPRRAHGWADVRFHIAEMEAAMSAAIPVDRPHV